jgi:hypothetical protein
VVVVWCWGWCCGGEGRPFTASELTVAVCCVVAKFRGLVAVAVRVLVLFRLGDSESIGLPLLRA